MTEAKNTPVIRISIQASIGEKAAMTFETYVAADSTETFLNAMADKLMNVKDRQLKKYELIDLNNYLKSELKQVQGLVDTVAQCRELAQPHAVPGRKALVVPNQQSKTNLENAQASLAKRREFVNTLKEDIAARETEWEEKYAIKLPPKG